MEKNVKLAALASTAILGVTAVMPVIANASTPVNAGSNTDAKTNATVSFKQNANNSSSVPPVSSNGSEGSTGSNGGATGETGDLTIDYITPSLNFGNHELDKDKHQAGTTAQTDTTKTDAAEAVATSTTDNIYNANYLTGGTKDGQRSATDPVAGTVKDDGTGDADAKDGFNGYYDNNVWMQFSKRQSETGADSTDTKNSSFGYNVTASMTDFKGISDAASGSILKGAQINFTKPNGKYYFDQKNILKDSTFAVGNGTNAAIDGGFVLTPGATDATTVITADKKTDAASQVAGGSNIPGLGTHVTTWAPSDIKLSVPQTTQNTLKTGDYKATISWMIAAKTA